MINPTVQSLAGPQLDGLQQRCCEQDQIALFGIIWQIEKGRLENGEQAKMPTPNGLSLYQRPQWAPMTEKNKTKHIETLPMHHSEAPESQPEALGLNPGEPVPKGTVAREDK